MFDWFLRRTGDEVFVALVILVLAIFLLRATFALQREGFYGDYKSLRKLLEERRASRKAERKKRAA